jgi:hypothetical protein
MSEYQRNRGMVVCIIAVLAVGAITVGGLTYLGSTGWWGNWNPAKTTFTFHADVGNTTGAVLLDVKLEAGGLTVQFVDNSSLLYRMSVEVQNSTLQQHGTPAVTFAGNKIALDYPAAGVNITLGTGVRYAIHGNVTAGGISATLSHGSRLANVSLISSAGGITVVMTNQIVVNGSVPVDLHTDAGGITVNVGLPTGVGGSFVGSVSAGGISVNAPSWTKIAQNHYETSNYSTASDKVTITAATSAGGISANLS